MYLCLHMFFLYLHYRAAIQQAFIARSVMFQDIIQSEANCNQDFICSVPHSVTCYPAVFKGPKSWCSDAPDSFRQHVDLIWCISRASFMKQQHWVLVLYWSCPQHWWWLDFLTRIVLLRVGPQHICLSLSKASVGKIRMILYHIYLRYNTADHLLYPADLR